MVRTSILLPRSLKASIARQASARGMSVGAYIRDSLKRAVAPKAPASETMFDLEVFPGPGPADVSANVDDYLYGAKRDLH